MAVFQPVIDSLGKIFLDIIDFIPHLVNGLIILIVGYLFSALIRWLIRFVLQRIRLQQLAERSGIVNALRNLGVRTPLPEIIAQIVFFFLLISFASAAMRLIGLAEVADLLENVLHFIPKAISAAILIVLGSMLARFLGNTISSVTESANITYAKALGKIIEYAILAFVVVLGISTLGVDTTILTSSITIIIASAGLAIALTFGLGSREAAKNVIAGYYVRQNFRPGQQVTLDEYNGKVRSTFGAYTVLDTVDEAGQPATLSLPNTLLLKRIIVGQEVTPAMEAGDNTPGTAQEGQP